MVNETNCTVVNKESVCIMIKKKKATCTMMNASNYIIINEKANCTMTNKATRINLQ